MKELLCKCLKCSTIMYDENPQIDAIPVEASENTRQMARDDEDCPVCPVCLTDNHLIDVSTQIVTP